MARLFNGTTQAMNSSATIDLTGTAVLTLSFWMYWDSFSNNDDLAFESSTNFNSNANAVFCDPNAAGGSFEVYVKTNAGVGYNGVRFTRPSGAAWHHYAITFDRNAGAQQVTSVYVDNSSQSLTSAASETTSGTFGNYTWYFMSRAASSLFGAGRMAEFGIWSATLGAAEIASLSKGLTPSGVRLASLERYWPIVGNTSPEIELMAGTGLTLTASPTATAHPRIYMPHRTKARRFTTAAAGGTTTARLIQGGLINGGILLGGRLIA